MAAMLVVCCSSLNRPQKIVINIDGVKKAPSNLTGEHRTKSTDVLSEIMGGQAMLATSSKDIEITKEGKCYNITKTHPLNRM